MVRWRAGEPTPLGSKWSHVYFKSFLLVCRKFSLISQVVGEVFVLRNFVIPDEKKF